MQVAAVRTLPHHDSIGEGGVARGCSACLVDYHRLLDLKKLLLGLGYDRVGGH
jgi:hypothetical protein